MNPPRPLLEIEHLVSADARRPLTVGGHHEWRESISSTRPFDEVDLMLDEHIQIDPYVTGTNSRRSDKELAKMLALIDGLPISENGKEGSH